MAESSAPRAPRHATTLPTLNIVNEHNRLNRVHEFPLRKQSGVISLSCKDDEVCTSRKISSQSVPEGKEALVLLHNGNGNAAASFLDEEDLEDDCETTLAEDSRQSPGPGVPDGGWGWAVVAAAFFINMASDGISFSFGLLYIEFLRYFGESRSTTAWIGSLFMAVPMLTGPVASAMVDRFGCRAMTILGGIISGIGFVASAFSETIGQMYLTFGVLAGLGLGLCFITAVVSITYWFEKKRTLAISLGAAGTGFGTFIYAPMTNYFISEFGWRGTILLLAGTFFNLCVCGVVMRDPAWTMSDHARSTRRSFAEHTEMTVMPTMSRVARSLPYTRAMSTRSEDNLAMVFMARYSSSAPPTPVGPAPALATPSVHTILEVGDASLGSEEASAGVPLLSGTVASTGTPVNPPGTPTTPGTPVIPGTPKSLATERKSNGGSPLRAESVPCFRRRVSLIAPGTSLFPARRRSSSYKETESRVSSLSGWRSWLSLSCLCGKKSWYLDSLKLLRAMLDFSLFVELHFLLMSAATTLLYTWFVVPYFYLADHLIRNGYTEAEASRLLSVVGVTNTIGMVGLGWVGDHPRMNVTKMYALCLAVCGSATACMLIFTTRYWLLFISCAAFGITFASTFSFTPPILVTLVPMESFTNAYGLNLLCQGIGNLLGPPFAGWLFDLTESWDYSFYMAGFWIVIAGVLTGLIPYTKNRRFIGSDPPSRSDSSKISPDS